MTPRTGVRADRGRGVRPAPVLGVGLRVLPLWLAWLLVVVLGRVVCHVAQRIPPVVRVVRLVRQRRGVAAADRAAAATLRTLGGSGQADQRKASAAADTFVTYDGQS